MASPDSTIPRAPEPGREIPTVGGDGPPDDPDATRLPDATDGRAASGPGPGPPGPGRFRRLRSHARGGLGEVFVARDAELNREVALKEIQDRHADHPESRARFLLEAEVTGGLEHPGIVPVYGLGTYSDGRPYYAMRFVRGDSLQEAIDRSHRAEGPGRDPAERELGLRQLLGRFVAVCNTIAYAHSRGVIHRDLKPANVMLGPYGETLVVDWGLAKPLLRVGAPPDDSPGRDTRSLAGHPDRSAEDGDDRSECPLVPSSTGTGTETVAGAAMGTPAYMSPEQAAGDLGRLGPAGDVYSLGATLYYLLTGRAPFAGRDVSAILGQVLRGEFPPPRQVRRQAPAALEAICLKAMALRPEDRYPSARALGDDIERWLADGVVSAYREPWSRRLARWARRHRAWVRAAAAALTLVAVAGTSAAVLVEQARGREHAERLRAEEQRRRAERLSADLLRQRGQAVGEQGDPARALLWLARALEVAPAEDAPLQASLRAALARWAGRVRPLRAVLRMRGPAAFTPDGRAVLVGIGDSARLHDVATGRPLGPACRHPGPIRCLALRGDGGAALLGGDDGTARLWDVVAGRPLGPPLAQAGPVVDASFGPDGRFVLVACAVASESRHEVRLWDPADGRPLGPSLSHRGTAATLAFRPDGRAALLVDPDGVLRVRDAATGAPIGGPLPPQEGLQLVALRPDGRAAVVARAAGRGVELRLWDLGSGRPLGPTWSHADPLLAATFRPDGEAIPLRGVGGGAQLFDPATGRPVGAPLAHPGIVLAAAFRRDGRQVLTGGNDNTARLWDAVTGAPLGPPRLHRAGVVVGAFSPDGRTALSGGGEDLQLWATSADDAGGGRPVPAGRLGITTLAYRPDARAIATGTLRGEVQLWDAATLAPLGTPLAPAGLAAALGPAAGDAVAAKPGVILIAAIAFDADGRALLTAASDVFNGRGAAQLRESAGGRPIGPVRRYPGIPWAAALSPDGRTIAVGGTDGTVRLWAVDGGPEGGRILRHPATINALAFSPDGRLLLTGAADREARLWDVAIGRLTGPTFAHRAGVRAVAFAPDGKVVATGGMDHVARLWDAVSGRPIGPPLEHADQVNAVAFSPEGRLLITGGKDRVARLWEAATGRPAGPPLDHQGEVRAVAFRPDGRAVLTDDAGTARAWGLPAPWEGRAERARLAAICRTGLELDEAGEVAALDADAWARHRRRLEEMGGPP